jgi:hypothetical protein
LLKRYGTIFGRVGIVLLLTGIVILVLSHFRSIDRYLDSNTKNYIAVGLVVVGVILLLVFVINFMTNKGKNT